MEFPATQAPTSTANIQNLFQASDGSALNIFVEAGGIQNRPQLMRRLRNAGASTCKDPKSSNIILVDPGTSQGRGFIRTWGTDTNKVVLDYRWVTQCIKEEKVLLNEDDWGGCLAHDDGLSIEGDEGSEPDVPKSPLPTPRETPDTVNGSRMGPPPARANHSQRPSTQSVTRQPETSVTAAMNRGIHTSPSPTMSAPDHHQPYPMSMPSMPNMALSAFPQMQGIPDPQVQLLLNMFMSQQAQFNSQSPFSLALQDTMKNYGVWPMQQPQSFEQNQPSSSQMPPTMYNQAGVNGMHQNYFPYPPLPPASSETPSSEIPVSVSPMLGPSVRRRSSSPSSLQSPAFRSSKDKAKRRDKSPPSKRRKTSGLSAHEAGPSAIPPMSQVSSTGKLFTSEDGKPLSFFVQIQLHNRNVLVSNIKKNGGRIENSPATADYAILYSGGHDFATLLKTALLAGKPAVNTRFVNDCVSQNAILDTDAYEFETSVRNKKKKVKAEPPSSGEEESNLRFVEKEQERKRLTKNAREAERRHRRKEENGKETSDYTSVTPKLVPKPPKPRMIGTNGTIQTTTQRGPPSPTPPLEPTLMQDSTKHKFTPTEREYILKYAKVMFERDHTMPTSTIASALYRKMPHHPLGSWRTHLGGIAEIDELRKRAGIAFRKAQSRQQSAKPETLGSPSTLHPHPTRTEPTEEESLQAKDQLETQELLPDPEPAIDCEAATEDDLNTAARFFVSIHTDTEPDDQKVWARLSAQAQCKTASTWEAFYDVHYEEVTNRYERFLVESRQIS